jgi:two-component system, sensor histidine kinase and response regulator
MAVDSKQLTGEPRDSQAEEKYRTILESIEEGYYETDLRGNFSFSNDSLCRILACRREDLMGSSYRSIVDRQTALSILRTFNQVYKSCIDMKRVEWQFMRRDNRKLYAEVSVARILSKTGECIGFRGLVRDVTQRVEAERALLESEQRYQLLAENVNDIIWMTDLDFNFTYVSPSVMRITGATMERTLELNLRHVMKHEEFDRLKGEIRQILEGRCQGEQSSYFVKRFEFEHYRLDESTFWAEAIVSGNFDKDGNPLGLVGVTRDITERVRTEEEIKKNEAKYRTILESIEEGYYEVDLKGRFTFFNEAMCSITGYAPEEMAGLSYKNYLDAENTIKVTRMFHRVYITGRPEKSFGWEYLRKDGAKVPAEASIQLMKDSNGNAAGFRGVVRDITGRSQADGLRAAKIKAEAESRAKSEFLANMSHEIRTPLNGIIGMTEIAMDTNLDENQRDIIHVINRESEILLSLINDILDFSKIEAERYELEEITFDLRVLIEDLAHSFAMRSEKKGLEFISFIAPEIQARLMGDPGRLRQVIANLAGNALKFTEKGEVFIRVETEQDLENESVLRFSVRDTGIGIPQNKQEKIFESFTQADGSTTRKYGGTGLGLAISKRIVEMMQGKIGVESVEGQGSTFFFTAKFKKGKDLKAYPQPEDISLRGMRVLVVDDNETNRFILMEYLKTWGCMPVDTPGGMEAVTLLRSGVAVNEPFDLILMDFHMPELDGFELSRKIREVNSLSRIPIILLTSIGDIGDGRACRDIGIQGYLPKPTRRDDLKKAVISVIGLSDAAQEEEKLKLVTRHSIAEDYRKDIQVLLVEDYPTNQQVVMRHLYKAGYQVDIAENGQQAVAAFKRKHYDLILMDIQMPVMDGYGATKAIRQWEEKMKREMDGAGRQERVPIIAMTAHATIGYRERCLREGMDDYLSKPLHREDMIACLDKWIRKRGIKGQGIASNDRIEEQEKGDAEMENIQPIDLNKAMDEFDADKDFLREILRGFLGNVRGQIEKIESALVKGNAETVRKEAHSIKGGAANICADALSKVASELEILGKAGSLDGAEKTLQRLEHEFHRLEEFDRKEL